MLYSHNFWMFLFHGRSRVDGMIRFGLNQFSRGCRLLILAGSFWITNLSLSDSLLLRCGQNWIFVGRRCCWSPSAVTRTPLLHPSNWSQQKTHGWIAWGAFTKRSRTKSLRVLRISFTCLRPSPSGAFCGLCMSAAGFRLNRPTEKRGKAVILLQTI